MAKSSAKPKPSLRDRAVKAALGLAARDGWRHVTLQAVAAESDIPLADLHDHFEDRFDLLAAYGRMIDRKVLEIAANSDETLSPRDRLFDLLMERFDVLNDDRAGVVAVLKDMKFDPATALLTLPHLGRSMGWMLEAARIDTSGCRGALKILGLTAVYLETLKHWMTDGSEDMSVTMAALDKILGRAEHWAGKLSL